MRAVLETVFNDEGLRFVFSTRSATPFILDEAGEPCFGGGYTFVPGKDEIIREGDQGYIVSYGEMLYRCLDVVERLRADGINVGLINKPTLNVVDEEMMDKLIGSRIRSGGGNPERQVGPRGPVRHLAAGKRIHGPLRPHGVIQGRPRRPGRTDPLPGTGNRRHPRKGSWACWRQ